VGFMMIELIYINLQKIWTGAYLEIAHNLTKLIYYMMGGGVLQP